MQKRINFQGKVFFKLEVQTFGSEIPDLQSNLDCVIFYSVDCTLMSLQSLQTMTGNRNRLPSEIINFFAVRHPVGIINFLAK